MCKFSQFQLVKKICKKNLRILNEMLSIFEEEMLSFFFFIYLLNDLSCSKQIYLPYETNRVVNVINIIGDVMSVNCHLFKSILSKRE